MALVKEIAAVLVAALLALAMYSKPIWEKYVTVSHETTPPAETTVAPETTNLPETTAAPETTETPETTAVPETTQAPETTDVPYDYSMSVPERESVSKDYFDDAVFIGNSRTRGFLTLAGLSKAGAYAYVGLTVDGVFSQQMAQIGDAKMNVINALREKNDWSKAYIMFGTNEIGWVDDTAFIKRYGELIDALRLINPDAVIYVQSVLPVSSIYTPSHPEYYMYNMPKINTYNALLRELAKEKEVYFVDVAEIMTNSDGYLFDEASRDGVHINRDYCNLWLEYLMTHTVEDK